jgi:hypothetical protein
VNTLPEWLNDSLPLAARHAGLAIGELGDERTFGRGGLAFTTRALLLMKKMQ